MTTQKATLNTEQLVYTFVIHILSRLEPKFKDSLSAVILGAYLCGSEHNFKNICSKSI
jgi:hypothetical protein